MTAFLVYAFLCLCAAGWALILARELVLLYLHHRGGAKQQPMEAHDA